MSDDERKVLAMIQAEVPGVTMLAIENLGIEFTDGALGMAAPWLGNAFTYTRDGLAQSGADLLTLAVHEVAHIVRNGYGPRPATTPPMADQVTRETFTTPSPPTNLDVFTHHDAVWARVCLHLRNRLVWRHNLLIGVDDVIAYPELPGRDLHRLLLAVGDYDRHRDVRLCDLIHTPLPIGASQLWAPPVPTKRKDRVMSMSNLKAAMEERKAEAMQAYEQLVEQVAADAEVVPEDALAVLEAAERTAEDLEHAVANRLARKRHQDAIRAVPAAKAEIDAMASELEMLVAQENERRQAFQRAHDGLILAMGTAQATIQRGAQAERELQRLAPPAIKQRLRETAANIEALRCASDDLRRKHIVAQAAHRDAEANQLASEREAVRRQAEALQAEQANLLQEAIR